MTRTITPPRIEEIGLNAWPALDTYLYDGWLLRFANGYTKRANSVTALYAGTLEVAEKVTWCQQLYRRRQLRPTFRLTSFSQPRTLDGHLAERGYRRIDTTSVQILDLTYCGALSSERAYMLPGYSGLESWLRSFHYLNPHRADVETHQKLLRKVMGQLCPMVLMVADEVVACGLGVLDGRTFGLFDVVTAPEYRNQGYGRELVESMLDWAIEARADTAYLQVMVENAPANHLYAKLGFSELYQYWYRILEDE